MTMDGYTLPHELKMMRDQIRLIVQEEIIPAESKCDPDAAEILESDFQRIAAKVKSLGFWYPSVPERYGGAGLNTFATCVLTEEMVQHRMGLYNTGCGVFGRMIPATIWAGSASQIQKYAVRSVEEGCHTFYAITEPSGGSDPAGAIQTSAVRKGDRYILNGRKIFISYADKAEWGVVFARTSKQAGRSGISAFVVDKSTSGWSARPIRTIRTSAIPNEVLFEDCEIPVEQRIGEEGQGLSLAFDLLTRERFPYSAANLGVAVAAQRLAVEYANVRQTFGQYLAERQAVQWMLADSEVEIRTVRWLVWEGAWKADRGEDARVEASIAKLHSSEVLGRVVDRAVQIFGGYGVAKELPLERWYREARIRRIGEGPSEVHRMVIARDLLRAGRQARRQG
jgi:acyl-CoA dehydrogenase